MSSPEDDLNWFRSQISGTNLLLIHLPPSHGEIAGMAEHFEEMSVKRLNKLFSQLKPAEIESWVSSITSGRSALSYDEKQKLFSVLADNRLNVSKLVLITETLWRNDSDSALDDGLMLGDAVNASQLGAHKKFDYFIELKPWIDPALVKERGLMFGSHYVRHPAAVLMGRFLANALSDQDDPMLFDRMVESLEDKEFRTIIRVMFGREMRTLPFSEPTVTYRPEDLARLLEAVADRRDLSLECGALSQVNMVHDQITKEHPQDDDELRAVRNVLLGANLRYQLHREDERKKYESVYEPSCNLIRAAKEELLRGH